MRLIGLPMSDLLLTGASPILRFIAGCKSYAHRLVGTEATSVLKKAKRHIVELVGLLVLVLVVGTHAANAEESTELQTVGDVTVISGMNGIEVEGWGLVVGLRGTGSNPPPSAARRKLLDLMKKRSVPSPESLLRSPATALVRVRGVIPPGARKGDRFDVRVELSEQDQATSLRHGWLLEAELYETGVAIGLGGLRGDRLALAGGPVVCRQDGEEARWGTIPGGGLCLVDRTFSLLTGNQYRSARYTMEIERRINQRFPIAGPGRTQVATAKDDTRVDLIVPAQYERNPARFLMVVRAIPLWSRNHTAEAMEERLNRYERELQNPATAFPAALALESMGSRAVGPLKAALRSPSPDVRFFAAEALAYLGEPAAAHVLAETARTIRDYRAHALTALSALDEPASRLELRQLLDSDDPELRYGAFRALRLQDSLSEDMRGILLDRHIRLHVVDSSGPPLIHVTLHGEPEIVVFGKDQKFLTPLTLRAGSEILITANTGAKTMLVSKYSLGAKPVRESVSLEVAAAIRHLTELGARYPDIVGMLELASRNHNLQGQLAIDALPDPRLLPKRLQRIASPEVAATSHTGTLLSLFHWGEPERRTVQPASAGPGVDAEKSEDDPRYLRRPPGRFERFWRRFRR